MAFYKLHINNYESYIIDQMEASIWPEVISYSSAIASFVLVIAGFATGPAGWISIVLNSASALLAFVGLTSSVYATEQRLQLSYNAMVNLENAREMIFQAGYYFEDVDADYFVSGF